MLAAMRLIRLLRLLPESAVQSLILRAALLRRAMSLGVRVLVEDDAGKVLLVRHTYLAGWHLPGGGVDVGESAEATAIRELREETGLVATERPTLAGFYRNPAGAGRNHVALYRVAAFTGIPHAGTDGEIADVGFFALDALPDGITRATLARLAEIFDRADVSETW